MSQQKGKDGFLLNIDPWLKNKIIAFLLITPACIILFTVVAYPLMYNLIMSFQDINLLSPDTGTPFIGLQNYQDILSDPIFWRALTHTAIWVISIVGIEMFLGVSAAIILNQKIKMIGTFRGLMLIPWTIPGVVAAFTWRWMYDARFGILNHFLVQTGILDEAVAWLGNYNTALGAVILPQIWKNFPFVMVLTLAALQSIPVELYEVAKVDGANFWQQLRYITLPSIKPTLYLASLLTTIWSFNAFSMIWILTEGGPAHASEVMTTYVYKKSFHAFDFGQSTATAVIMFGILFVFVILYGKKVFQGGEQ